MFYHVHMSGNGISNLRHGIAIQSDITLPPLIILKRITIIIIIASVGILESIVRRVTRPLYRLLINSHKSSSYGIDQPILILRRCGMHVSCNIRITAGRGIGIQIGSVSISVPPNRLGHLLYPYQLSPVCCIIIQVKTVGKALGAPSGTVRINIPGDIKIRIRISRFVSPGGIPLVEESSRFSSRAVLNCHLKRFHFRLQGYGKIVLHACIVLTIRMMDFGKNRKSIPILSDFLPSYLFMLHLHHGRSHGIGELRLQNHGPRYFAMIDQMVVLLFFSVNRPFHFRIVKIA